MKRMKKVLAMFLSLAMVLGMSVTAFAEETSIEKPTKKDTAKVEISGGAIKANAGITFEAYQLIKAKFDAKDNFEGYEWVTGYGSGDIQISTPDKVGGLTNIEGLNSTNINKWASQASGGAVEDSKISWDGNTAKIDLAVGTWMIIAKSTDKNLIFNPMVASVYYKQSGGNDSVAGGTVNAGGMWQLVTENAYEKSTDLTTTNEKKVGSATIVDGKVVFTEAEANAQVSENRAYQLKGLIPSYSAEYFDSKTVVYKLKDTKNSGLEYNDDIQVSVGGEVIAPTEGENKRYAVKWYTDNTFSTEATEAAKANAFVIEFDSAYIQGLASQADAGRAVEVVYTAKVTSAAVTQVAENSYTVDYTRDPAGTVSSADLKTVYTYTAAINGAIKKVDEKHIPLPGAKFELTYTENGTTKTLGTYETKVEKDDEEFKASSGNIKFEGLKFGREYILKETQAPDGYSINTTEYKIVCSYPEGFDDKDATKLEKYNVTVTNMTTNASTTIEVNYGGSADVLDNAVEFVNTTLTSLPSTGGIGTTIFTVVGCIVMIAAAGLFFASRRKNAVK